jgi:hypothetical protein
MSANFEFLGGLPPEHITALQVVDLRLAFAPHGANEYDPKIGLYVSAEQDSYEVLKDVVDGLQADRGDQLAVEARGYVWPTQIIDTIQEYTQLVLRGSRLANDVPDGDFAAALEEGRRAYALGPFRYAMGHALLKGVPVHHADFSSEQLEAWKDGMRSLRGFERLAYAGVGGLVETEARNKAMVGRLGEIAAGMVAADPALRLPGVPKEERPVLQHIAGIAHDGDVMRQLRKQNVPFTATRNDLVSPVYFPGVHVIETAAALAVDVLRAPLGLSLRSRLRREARRRARS